MRRLNDLMAKRICNLELKLKNSHLYPRVLQLYDELKNRNLRFRPPCYFADEWFVPEGDPVIGIPFYLANHDLIRLEKKMMGEAEGDKLLYFMKLLRHEAGHAITYAFNLNKRSGYRAIFGPTNKLFSELYAFDKKSKNFVINLKDYYAQSHPDEDFAETFAVWLADPDQKWRTHYRSWPALKKLLYVDSLMKLIKDKKPLKTKGVKMCHVSTLKYSIWTYYMRRRSLVEHRGRVKI